MTTAERCCFMRSDIGCTVLGLFTFVVALLLTVYSSVVLDLEHRSSGGGSQHLTSAADLTLNSSSLAILLVIVIVVSIVWMLFSIFLIVGVKTNRSSFLLFYFSYGVMVAILLMLGSLLLLLTDKKHWYKTLIINIADVIYVHCLVMVYHTYDLMQRGVVFGENSHQLLEEDDFASEL